MVAQLPLPLAVPTTAYQLLSYVRSPDTRDRRQLLELAGERAHLLLDARRQFPDRRAELVDALQV